MTGIGITGAGWGLKPKTLAWFWRVRSWVETVGMGAWSGRLEWAVGGRSEGDRPFQNGVS